MCGICGMVDHEGLEPDAEQRLRSMVRLLHHRGPDQQGTFRDGLAALGHSRLSIIDVCDGRQPMCNENGRLWVAFNGEIYNFRELREGLVARGHELRTRCDTEVILHLFEEEGIDCVQHFRGMFAIALWDAARRELYLVRDRLGIKPVYYAVRDGRLIFGSEIKAILAHGGIERRVSEQALADYMTFLYVPAPKTMFRDIWKLPAGHWLRFSEGGRLHVQQYWDLRPAADVPADRGKIEERLIELLTEAVKLRLVSDVPLGAFLSGGVDSSSVVAMMARAGHRPLLTSSIGFAEDAFNELPFARQVARRYGTEHHEDVVTPQSVQIVRKLAWHYDEPFADDSAVPTFYVSQAARRFVTVALSGDGGDENFAGYRRHRFDRIERRVRAMLPRPVRRLLVAPLGRLYPKADWLPTPLRAKRTLQNIASDEADAYTRSVGFLDDDTRGAFLAPDVAEGLAGYRSADIIRGFMATARAEGLDEATYADIKTYLVDDILTKVDRASMAVALEVRVPLLDHKFMEFVAGIPASMKIDAGGQKSIFRSALRLYLDAATLDRPKQGFTPPTVQWLRGPLQEMGQDLLLGPSAFCRQWLDGRRLERAWQQHRLGVRNWAPLLWSAMMLELWGRRFLSGRGAPEELAEAMA